MPVTPSSRAAARIVGNRFVRRVLGFDHPKRDIAWAGITWGMKVLEIGPGSGLFTEALLAVVGPRGRVVGVEYSHEAASLLLERFADGSEAPLDVVVGDARSLPLGPAARFDAVCCFYSLEEVAGSDAVAALLASLVEPRGLFVAFFWRPLARSTKRDAVARAVESVGFRLVGRRADVQNVRLVWRREEN